MCHWSLSSMIDKSVIEEEKSFTKLKTKRITGLVTYLSQRLGSTTGFPQKRVAHRILNASLGHQIFGPNWPNVVHNVAQKGPP